MGNPKDRLPSAAPDIADFLLEQFAGSFIAGNQIGVNADSSNALPNGRSELPDDGLAGTDARAGVYVAGSNNMISGATRGVTGNIIAFNAGAGISVASGTGNTIRGNTIFSNEGLGIDIAGDGVTFNHVGFVAGPNDYQNYPVMSVATSDGESMRVGGYLESEANQDYSIDIFANETCDPTFFGEGERYLGSFSVSTNESGLAIFDELISAGAIEPIGISATATGQQGHL